MASDAAVPVLSTQKTDPLSQFCSWAAIGAPEVENGDGYEFGEAMTVSL